MIALFIILIYAQYVAFQTQYVHLFRHEANACQALFIIFEQMLAQALEIRIFISAAVVGMSFHTFNG